MPVYFEIRSQSSPLPNRSSADALSEILQDAVREFDVRVVSIRPDKQAYIYACAVRQRTPSGTLVSKLRSDARLRNFQVSSEATSADGPFAWT